MKSTIVRLLPIALLLTGIVGQVSAAPIANKTDLSSIGSGSKETSLGDFVADVLRTTTGNDIALVPSSALREVDLPAGGVQASAIADIPEATSAPANAYVTVLVKGKQILAALERSVSRTPESYDGFLQVSGVQVTYDLSKPAGSRIVSVILANGQPISPDSQYSVAMTQPLALGSMGYFQAWDESDISKTFTDSLSDLLVTYAQAHQPLDNQIDGRLSSK